MNNDEFWLITTKWEFFPNCRQRKDTSISLVAYFTLQRLLLNRKALKMVTGLSLMMDPKDVKNLD